MAFTVEGKDGTKITAGTIEGLRLVLEELSASTEETSVPSEEESPLLTSDQLKEGDKVRILSEPGNFEVGEFHGHVKDSIGIVTEVVSENIIEVEAPGELSPSETIIQGHSPSRLERVEPLGKDANGEDLFEGDYVTGASGNGYTYTDDSVIMKVLLKEDAVGHGIRADIGVEIIGEHRASIDSFEVQSERFIRLSGDLDEAMEKFAEIKFGEVLRTESRFKVGDKVRIVENSTNGLPVGDVGEIVRVAENDKDGYEYYVKGDRYDSSMIHEDSDLELLKEEDDLLPVGTKVRLLHGSSCGDLRKGEVGTIAGTDRGCAAGLEYKVRVRDGLKGYGWLRKDYVEVVEEKSLKVGDKVKVISAEDGTDSGYHGFIIGSIVEVEEVYGNGRIEAYNGNFHQTLLPHHFERESSSTEFRTGDIVKVTETFEDIRGNVAASGTVCEYDEWSDSWRFVGAVLVGDNHDKLRLVCRKEDRKDIDL